MRRPLVVLYDFAPNPSEFPYIWGKFLSFFISVGTRRQTEKQTAVIPATAGIYYTVTSSRMHGQQLIKCINDNQLLSRSTNTEGHSLTDVEKRSIEINSSSWPIRRSKPLCYPQPERPPSLPLSYSLSTVCGQVYRLIYNSWRESEGGTNDNENGHEPGFLSIDSTHSVIEVATGIRQLNRQQTDCRE